MKYYKEIKVHIRNLLLISLVVLISSCGSLYYQVYETQPEGSLGENLVYENSDLIVAYDFWSKGGNSSFCVYNKTDKNIFIDLGLSHFIVNGVAYTYYQDRSFSESTYVSGEYNSVVSNASNNLYATLFGSGQMLGGGYTSSATVNLNTVSSSTSWGTRVVSAKTTSNGYREQRVVCIPPKSMKPIQGFYINRVLFKDCDLRMYPKGSSITPIYDESAIVKQEGEGMTFEKSTTPLSFKNIVSYGFSENSNKDNVLLENEFWVKRLVNCTMGQFRVDKMYRKCGKKKTGIVYVYKDRKNFFIDYSR